MENIKKYKFSFTLLIIFFLLVIIHIALPSKKKVSEVEIKTIKKNIRMVDVNAYYIEVGAIKEYTFSTVEDSYSNLLKITVQDMLDKSFIDGNKPSLLNIYFSDTSIYFQFNTKDIDPLLKEAIQKTTIELLDISDIKFI